ncbi:MAG TPA: transglutaminase family protein, partial [Fimbriimonadaceae bacterium]|nr:transglutaminase family protein [Fimbriimonadaceae bacterium]
QKVESSTVIDAGLLGQAMSTRIDSITLRDGDKTLEMRFEISSAGRKQITLARFEGDAINISLDNSGSKSTRRIPLPKDAPVVDDATLALLQDGVAIGASKAYYVLDPMTLSLSKNVATLKGPSKVKVGEKEVDATLIEVVESRATTRLYVSAKGDFIKGEGPMGIEMLPISKQEALEVGSGTVDLADSTRIAPNKPIPDPSSLSQLRLRVTGRDLKNLPSDGHQTLEQDQGGWEVSIHPLPWKSFENVSLAQAGVGRGAALSPSPLIPSDSKKFSDLAGTLTKGKVSLKEIVSSVHGYVNRLMTPNAGIGVLRDAGEVLETKEGVCRDYAILTATIFRAARVPSRLCSGLIYMDGAFYYHAWVEVWDSKKWIGVDSTRPDGELTPGHVKLAHGNVDEAFNFTVLDGVKIEVLGMIKK